MGEAKRRGTFIERRDRAIEKNVALLAIKSQEPERFVITASSDSEASAREMWSLMDAVARCHGQLIYRRQGV
jgi:hypothetical protein